MKAYKLREPVSAEINTNLAAYSELTRALLYNRGISTPEEAEIFLNPDYDKHIHDPFLLKDMDKAVARILEAIEKSERILIYSDYDADGIPGAVVMHDAFKLLGYDNFEIYIPHRHNEGYGLHLEALETFPEKGIKLLITLDCGIVDHEEVAHAQLLGMDVIVTDHHLPRRSEAEAGLLQDDLPPAFAVVNPKRADCDYPYDMLCGSGVAFKLAQALFSKYHSVPLRPSGTSPKLGKETSDQAGVTLPNLGRVSSLRDGMVPEIKLNSHTGVVLKPGAEKWLLDMVGIATLSDMVPLKGENRVLAHYGLKVLRKSRRPGFQKLLKMIKVDQRYITEDDVGFMITPRINAASRMGIPTDAFHLLSTTDATKGDELAKHLDSINNERKGLVASTVKEIKKILAEREEHFAGKNVIVLGNPNWRPALLGLAANTIAEEFNKPVFLWGRSFDETQDGEAGKGTIKGSCRSDGVTHLVQLMNGVKDYFIEYGGHAFSGGFAVHSEKIHAFEDALHDAHVSLGNAAATQEPIQIDAKLQLEDVSWRLQQELDKLAPFGMDNPKPLFMFENIKPAEVKLFGKTKDHLDLSFYTSQNKKIRAIGFFMKPEDFTVQPKKGIPMTLIATIEKSYFGASPEIRLRIVDCL